LTPKEPQKLQQQTGIKMTVKISTGLATSMVNDKGFKEAMDGGTVELWSGAQPATADAAPTGTLLAIGTKDALPVTPGSLTNGLVYATPTTPTISKSADNWKYSPIAAGIVGWARFKANAADTGSVSTTALRMDCSAGSAGAELVVANPQFTVGVPGSIDSFLLTMPMQ
jgi:hypothetical protein